MLIYEIALHPCKPEKNFYFESRYNGYKRIKITATKEHWRIIKHPGNLFTQEIEISNKYEIRFPLCESGTEMIYYLSIMKDNKIIFLIKVDTIHYVKSGESPFFPPGTIRLITKTIPFVSYG